MLDDSCISPGRDGLYRNRSSKSLEGLTKCARVIPQFAALDASRFIIFLLISSRRILCAIRSSVSLPSLSESNQNLLTPDMPVSTRTLLSERNAKQRPALRPLEKRISHSETENSLVHSIKDHPPYLNLLIIPLYLHNEPVFESRASHEKLQRTCIPLQCCKSSPFASHFPRVHQKILAQRNPLCRLFENTSCS